MSATATTRRRLPALATDAAGNRRIDMRAVLALAAPLVLNSTIQSVLGLTDTWFIGRLSVSATAAMAAVYWLVVLSLFLFSGATMAVQTLVAQSWGGGRYRRASQAMWTGVWGAVATTPIFVLLIWAAPRLLGLFGLAPGIESLALDYWQPRMMGGPLAATLWGMTAYFNGIGHTRLPLLVTSLVAVSNVFLDQLFIFDLGFGISGAAWATNCAQAAGIALAMYLVFNVEARRTRPTLTWRPRLRGIWRQLRLGVPMAATGSADLLAAALFQLMQVRIGAVDGAATQIVMVSTSIAYMPGIGMALAATTLVGQSIGAGDRNWAERLGNRMIAVVSLTMGALGIAMALAGPVLAPLFVNPEDPHAAAVIQLSMRLLWVAALYQFTDGLNFSSNFCLRGAGDVKVPALLVASFGFGFFMPATYLLTFAPGQGWFGGPGFGFGAVGGWSALASYSMLIGVALLLRWRHGAWRRIRLR